MSHRRSWHPLRPIARHHVFTPCRRVRIADRHAARHPGRSIQLRVNAGSTGGPGGTDAASLFSQWWDTQNDALHSVTGEACSSEINGFPVDCPRQEGILATADPFGGASMDDFFPIGLVNRFDTLPSDSAHCGQYRIVYGKRPNPFVGLLDQVLVIFEAQMPNPDPGAGIAGCKVVAEIWPALRVYPSRTGQSCSRTSTTVGSTGFPPPSTSIIWHRGLAR